MNSYNGHSSKTHSITANNTPILNSLSLYSMKRKEWPGNEITQMLSFTPFQYAGFGMFVTSATHLLSVCYRYVTIYAWFCVINYHRLNVLALGILLIRFANNTKVWESLGRQNYYRSLYSSHNVYNMLGLWSVMPLALCFQNFASALWQTRAKSCNSCNRDSYGRS